MSGFIAGIILLIVIIGLIYVISLPIGQMTYMSGEVPRWRRSQLNTMLSTAANQSANWRRNQSQIENAIIAAQWRYDNTWKPRDHK